MSLKLNSRRFASIAVAVAVGVSGAAAGSNSCRRCYC